jgi:hypothetical protein
MAPDGQVFLDELEHRWDNPDAPPTLYVLTCKVGVHHRSVLVAGDTKLGQEALSTKIGETRRSLAPRIRGYHDGGFRGVSILSGSLVLRVVIYGVGSSMVCERELRRFAKENGTPVEWIDNGDVRRRVSSESFDGDGMIEAICTYARAHTSVSVS